MAIKPKKKTKATWNVTRDKKGRITKGTGGRVKGVKNKFTTVKGEFLAAFEEMGGRKAIIEVAKKSDAGKVAMLNIMSKMLPKEIELSGKDGGPIETTGVICLPPKAEDKD